MLKLPTRAGAPAPRRCPCRAAPTARSFSDLVASAGYAFNPAQRQHGDDHLQPRRPTRYVRLNITANTAWPAGQISELEVYGPADRRHASRRARRRNLAFTQPASGQIRLTWNASTDNVGVTGYDIYANGALRTSVGNVLTYTDTQPASATVAYFVRAKDAAGNQSGNSNTVTRHRHVDRHPGADRAAGLAYTQPASGQIRLTWNASTDNVGVTGYDVYANGSVRASVAGNVLTYTDSQPATATVSYYVRAKDAAGNVSGNSNTVTRTGTGGPGGTNLAVGKPITGSSTVHTFVAANANDDNDRHLLGGRAGRLPEHADRLARARTRPSARSCVKLNPGTAWGPRTQTFSILGREQSSSTFTTLVGVRDLQLQPGLGRQHGDHPGSARPSPTCGSRFTANTGASNGQVAEFQVIGTPAPNPDLTVSAHLVRRRPRRSRPTRSRCRRRSATSAPPAPARPPSTSTWARPRSAPRTSARSRPARRPPSRPNIGPRNAGTYQLSAKVDESNTVIEQNDANNTFTGGNLVVGQVAELRPGRRSGELVAEQPGGRQHGHLLGGHPQPGHDRLGQRRARHHPDRAQRVRRVGPHADRLVSAARSPPARPRPRSPWAPGRPPTAGTRCAWCSPTTPTSCRSSRPTTPATGRSSSVAARTCPTTCTRPRTASIGGGAQLARPEPDDRRPRR